MSNEKNVYFGEVLLNDAVCEGDTVFVQLGGNASADMWESVAKAMQQQGGAAALRMKVKLMSRPPKQEQSVQEDGIFADRAKELAAELLRDVVDDMQQCAKDGMLVMLDDDGNAHMIDPLQEDDEQAEPPTDAEDKLRQQAQRVNKWIEQQGGM